MSGGTWDYRDRALRFLAEEVRDGIGRGADPYDDDERLPLPGARGLVAEALMVLANLLHELDYHFAGDSEIGDEDDWIVLARAKIIMACIK